MTTTPSGTSAVPPAAPTPSQPASPFPSLSTIQNLSVRGFVGPGDQALIAGFVIGGSNPIQVLIRGIGGQLVDYGITTGFLGLPFLELFNTGGVIESAASWNTETAAAAEKVGAFPLTTTGNAAMLVTLPPGVYTCKLSGDFGSTGIGLLEFYLFSE